MPSTTEEVITHSGDIDVHVVTHSFAHGRGWRVSRAALPRRRVRLGYAAAIIGPVVLTGLLVLLPEDPGLPLTVPLYLLTTVLIALLGGIGPAIVGAVASSLLLNWFFTHPVGTLTISQPENAVALVVFVLVAVVVAFVVHTSARRAERAVAAQRESAALAELTHTLLGSTDQMTVLLEHAVDMFGAQRALVVRRATADAPAEVVAEVASDTAATTDETRGPGSPTSPDREQTHASADDEHDLVLVGTTVPADRQRLLAAFAAHAGAILQRRALQQAAGEAAVVARDSSARTALLSAVSHDLRTPLAGIKAAIGSLRSSEVTFSPEDQAELEAAIEDSADRLDALIGNLLDMSRLQAGALIAAPRPVDLGEVVPAAVAALSEPGRVDWALEPDARLVEADPGLLDRVLGNVLENALRHQPPPGQVRVSTSRLGWPHPGPRLRHRPRGARGGARADLPALPTPRRRTLRRRRRTRPRGRPRAGRGDGRRGVRRGDPRRRAHHGHRASERRHPAAAGRAVWPTTPDRPAHSRGGDTWLTASSSSTTTRRSAAPCGSTCRPAATRSRRSPPAATPCRPWRTLRPT